jgi:hypothetical protein
MRLPIDTKRRQWVAVSASQQKTDQKGDARTDQRTGAVLFVAQLVPIGDEVMREALSITVDFDPQLQPGQFVEIEGLVANYWENDGRSGLAFRAAKITPVKPQVVPAPASSSAA